MKWPVYAKLLFCFFAVFLQSCTNSPKTNNEYYTVEDFSSVEKIDAHVHVRTISNPAYVQQAAADNFKLITVSVNSPSIAMEEQVVKANPERLVFVASFSVENWHEPDWQEKTLAHLKDAFAKGAIAVKGWKNIGLELRDKDGKFVMIDDPRFDPIINLLEANNIPMIGHFSEPKNCWLPVAQMTVKGDRDYFSQNPEYHMYLHPEYPSYEEQIAARDRMLEKHPKLRFVGAHLGSLEWSVDELAKRLDKYPNMAVDMAERISHLQHQAKTDWQKVHDFFIKYQDRLIYATDFIAQDNQNPAEVKENAHNIWLRHWRFFTTDEQMQVPKVTGAFKGMQLPRTVVDKIYRQNALKWLPGVGKLVQNN
ncbi:amidohydrolase family protein [Adhaeribacter rhizoryzae]|uniref:Amidohydrolase family protein n=1 Tax=Adhaeribacter rhizoryzae TaxID=2607907 RepID=A0A5M6DF03_9BACT|nr:amidohydrolase family protein [Adhaeribacter rhizoryzae]KAA5544976.1 amidohydrolase family protein [Adhaeribacter rhizoryzae]